MAITCEDRAAITEVIARHGHLCDSGELDRLDEVFTADVTYDLTDFGQQVLHGPQALAAAGWALGELNPVGHHVTNVVLTEAADGTVQARSKGIGINADGTCASVTYEDTVVHGERGWRISQRKISPRRAPLGGKLSA
ncbi:MAG TPA: nuclear transport factor 2 family protein [Streptosporangiaceae bacterium]|nr:nuclear transport factor 2 family protein [Streptosporangiaceae bacterium]